MSQGVPRAAVPHTPLCAGGAGVQSGQAAVALGTSGWDCRDSRAAWLPSTVLFVSAEVGQAVLGMQVIEFDRIPGPFSSLTP